MGFIEGFLEEINTELTLTEGAGVRTSVVGREGGSLMGSEWDVPETEQCPEDEELETFYGCLSCRGQNGWGGLTKQ